MNTPAAPEVTAKPWWPGPSGGRPATRPRCRHLVATVARTWPTRRTDPTP